MASPQAYPGRCPPHQPPQRKIGKALSPPSGGKKPWSKLLIPEIENTNSGGWGQRKGQGHLQPILYIHLQPPWLQPLCRKPALRQTTHKSCVSLPVMKRRQGGTHKVKRCLPAFFFSTVYTWCAFQLPGLYVTLPMMSCHSIGLISHMLQRMVTQRHSHGISDAAQVP